MASNEFGGSDYIPLRHRPRSFRPVHRPANALRFVAGDPAEQRMQEMEAAGDREQTAREEHAKREARRIAEASAPQASEKQVVFIRDLLEQTNQPAEKRQAFETQVAEGKMPKDRASRYIETLLERRKAQPRQTSNTPAPQYRDDVPAGRYALTGQDGTTDFYRVDRPTEGRWAGYVFCKLVLGGGNDQRLSRTHSVALLDRIAEAGPQEAMLRYGREIGECGHCGRTLTNETSRERGIGPVCARHMGW